MHVTRMLVCAIFPILAWNLCGLAGDFTYEPAKVPKGDFFVSTSGKDWWSGKLPAPNRDGTDGPFATVERARDTVREYRAAAKPDRPVTVLIRGGTYYIADPIVFTTENSGTLQSPTIFAAYEKEQPVISGGRKITGWKRHTDRIWKAEIPEVKSGDLDFRMLYVNGYRRVMARTPNQGDYYRMRKGINRISFGFNKGEITNRSKVGETDAVILPGWESAMLPIASVDEARQVVTLTGPMLWDSANHQRYYIENFYEALDSPGEWFLDRAAGVLYYYPKTDEKMDRVDVIAPLVTQFLVFDGLPSADRFVDNIVFKGVAFRHGDYTLEPTGHSDRQAAVSILGAIQADGARRCVFEQCEVAHIGIYAIWFKKGCVSNTVAQCEIFDVGAGGVRIGEQAMRGDARERTFGNAVYNNYIHDGSCVYYGAVPVWIGQSSGNSITHNEICDFNYSGISAGWTWGFEPTLCHSNRIDYNHIHHLGGPLCDMAGIYTLGISIGTTIRNNHIHHIFDNPDGYGAAGIYPDEGSTGLLIENNVVYRTTWGGFMCHYGRSNLVSNNIFAFGRDAQFSLGREDKKSSQTLERNIFYYDRGELMTEKMSTLSADFNVYYRTSKDPVLFAKKASFDEWRKQGYDTHSIIADPMFVDPANGDFRLKAESPALKLGFRQIDIGKAGLVGDREWTGRLRNIVRRPWAFPEKYIPPPLVVDDGFEDNAVGDKPGGATVYGSEGKAGVRVAGEAAAAGSRSLKFTDSARLKDACDPHMKYSPSYTAGTARASFDLRIEKDAKIGIQWRDWTVSPFIAGPSLTIAADGGLQARGTPLLALPVGKWVRFEIECKLGSEASGAYDLVVTVAGEEPKRFLNLPCDPKFAKVTWIGFTSDATYDTAFYLDNIRIGNEL